MRYLDGIEEVEAIQFFDAAAEIAKSSKCGRAHCGALIVKDDTIIGSGVNKVPGAIESQRRCNRKDELPKDFKSDMTCCIHAEVSAIHDAMLTNPDELMGSRIYFMRRNVANEVQKSGKLYCTICSKAALDAGVAEFALWQEKGVAVFDTEEFNDLSFASKKTR